MKREEAASQWRERDIQCAVAKRTEAEIVASLETAWPELLASISTVSTSFDADLALWRKQFPDDPIAIETDLLSPLGDERYEPAHTQAIAYLIGRGHPLAVLAQARFLDVLLDAASRAKGAVAKSLRELSDRNDLTCMVTPERFALLGGKTLKTDLWLDVRSGRQRLLIVVENKVDSHPTDDQLQAYARLASEHANGATVGLFLLSLDDEPELPPPWIALDYEQLAVAWLSLLEETPSSTREFARLYLATIFQHLCGLQFRAERLSHRAKQRLAEYMRIRLEPL